MFIFSSVGKPEFLYSSYLHAGPPLVSCHLPQATIYQKHQNFPCQTIAVRSSRQWPQPNFFAMRGLDYCPLFLLSCKQVLDTSLINLYVHWMHVLHCYRLCKNIFMTTWNYSYCNLEIAFSESLSKCRCVQTFSRKRLPVDKFL